MSDDKKERDEHLKKMFSLIAKKTGNNPCPVCGELSKKILINTEENQPIIVSKQGQTVDVYSFFCNNCFYVTSFLKRLIDNEISEGDN